MKVAVIQINEALAYVLLLAVSLAKIDGGTVTKCNFAGDQGAGASWTDKIMASKADAAQKPGGEGDGAGEDEWVRALLSLSVLRKAILIR